MTAAEPTAALTLALHIEGSAGADAAELTDLPEVATVDGVTTSNNRGLDPTTIETTLLMLTTIAGSAATLTATVNTLIGNIEKLAARLGWHRVTVEVGRKTVALADLSAEQKQQLLEQALAQAKAAPAGPA